MSVYEQLTMSEEDLATHSWVHDPTHLGVAMTPLFQSFMLPAIERAMENLARATGRPPHRSISRVYHGYVYDAVEAEPARPTPEVRRAGLEAMLPQFRQLTAEFNRVLTEELLPLYAELDGLAARVTTRAEALAALQRLGEIYDRCWTLHMQIVMPVFSAQELYELVFLDFFPGKSAADAHTLLAGASNQFTEADRALAALAETVRSQLPLRRALADAHPLQALKQVPGATAFLKELDAILDRYGWRVGGGHDFFRPSWREDPTPALVMVRQFLERDMPFETQWQAIVSQQKAALHAVRSQLDPEKRRRFDTVFELAWAIRPLDEDHNFYIDAMLPAKSRPLLLRFADRLVEDGCLQHRDQIFFLYRDELEAMLSGKGETDPAVLSEREASYHQYCRETPPAHLGLPLSDENEDHQAPPTSLTGLAASAGIREGQVRIINGPDDFARLQAGDILVARTTTPSWSGLIAAAGAVVTDAGGILSHTATVAREYGVPCVVAVRQATTSLRDGDWVVVDGARGTVKLLRRPEGA